MLESHTGGTQEHIGAHIGVKGNVWAYMATRRGARRHAEDTRGRTGARETHRGAQGSALRRDVSCMLVVLQQGLPEAALVTLRWRTFDL